MAVRTYRDLQVFQEAYRAALDVSRMTKTFPGLEQPKLGRQLRRVARSVPANVVEGWAKRASASEFKRFLQVAIGSCDEAKMWLDISKDEGYLSEHHCAELKGRYNRIGAMLQSLWRKWHGTAR